MVPRFYKKNVVEGRNTLVLFVLFAIVVRVVYFLGGYLPYPVSAQSNYLWEPVSSLFINQIASITASLILVIILAIVQDYINAKHVVIRHKTSLIPAFTILLFSSHPVFFSMNAQSIASLFVVYAILTLFAAYGSRRPQNHALNIGVILATGSLFSPFLLIYYPVFWFGLIMLNSFNFKSLLASLLGLILIYFLAFSYFFYTGQIDLFLAPFTSIGLEQFQEFIFLKFDYTSWAILVFYIIVLAIMAVRYYATKYKDKIKIRAFVSFLGFLSGVSFLFFFLLNLDPLMCFYVAFCSIPFLMAHFFALAEEKWVTVFFYLLIIVIMITSFLPILSLL